MKEVLMKTTNKKLIMIFYIYFHKLLFKIKIKFEIIKYKFLNKNELRFFKYYLFINFESNYCYCDEIRTNKLSKSTFFPQKSYF